MSLAAVRSRPNLAPLQPSFHEMTSTISSRPAISSLSLTPSTVSSTTRSNRSTRSSTRSTQSPRKDSIPAEPSWNITRRVHLYIDVRVRGKIQPMLVPHMLTYVLAYDRTFLFRCYRRCFLGSDAIAFFVKAGYAKTVNEARALGNALLKAGLFRHVKNQHLLRNGQYFYRFANHEDYCRDEDDAVTMRSSRMMSVACNSFLGACPVKRIDAGPALSDISDITVSDGGSAQDVRKKPRAAFGESEVKVEIGIRIGSKTFPNLVSEFVKTPNLVGTNYIDGKKYPKSFLGSEAVQWLVDRGYARNIKEGVKIGNALLNSGVFHPMASQEGFDCNSLPYKFTADVDTSKALRKGAVKDKILKYLMGINRDNKNFLQASPWFEHTLSNISHDKKVLQERKTKAILDNNRVDLLPDAEAKPIELPTIDPMSTLPRMSELFEEEKVASSAVTIYSRDEHVSET